MSPALDQWERIATCHYCGQEWESFEARDDRYWGPLLYHREMFHIGWQWRAHPQRSRPTPIWVCPACRTAHARAEQDAGRHYDWRSTRARATRIQSMRDEGMTLEAIGDEYGLSRERVRQILVKASRTRTTRIAP